MTEKKGLRQERAGRCKLANFPSKKEEEDEKWNMEEEENVICAHMHDA